MSTLALTGAQALWFAPLSIPLCLWAAYTDLQSLRIPNAAVLAMLAVFAVTGLFALGLADYLWRYAHFAVVLAVGFVLWALPGFGFGAGDAKFAAAIAPFVALQDASIFLLILCATTIIGFALYKIASRIPWIRRVTPNWTSWSKPNSFPWGLSLSSALILYLAIALEPVILGA